MDPERASIWWPIILAAFLAVLVFIGSHRHAHAAPRDGNEARFRWEHNGESIGKPSDVQTLGIGKVKGVCTRMKATDTLILNGHRQHAEHFVECIVGHWPNVDSVFQKVE
jgi:hypothetical protein